MTIEFFYDPTGDPKSLLVVNKVGVLRRVYAPFKVICIKPVENIAKDTQVYVDAVFSTINGELYFFIFWNPYPHTCFRLLIQF